MKSSNRNHPFFLGLMVLTTGLANVAILPSTANKSIRSSAKPTQNLEMPRPRSEKYIGKYRIYSNEPVLVTDLTVKSIKHEINSKVNAGEDWLNGLNFKVKNISNKNIVYIYVSVLFPETKVITGTLFAVDLRYGADPKVEAASPKEKPLKPEEAAEFVISDAFYQLEARNRS